MVFYAGWHDLTDMNANIVKLYLLLGICGGVGDITIRYLERTGKYAEFRSRLEWLYNLTFADGIIGEDIDFVLPNAKIPNVSSPFTGCTGSFRDVLSYRVNIFLSNTKSIFVKRQRFLTDFHSEQ
jgi:hypothetical protein